MNELKETSLKNRYFRSRKSTSKKKKQLEGSADRIGSDQTGIPKKKSKKNVAHEVQRSKIASHTADSAPGKLEAQKKKSKKAKQQESHDMRTMAKELEAEKSLTAELRNELEKIRKEKEQLETLARPTSTSTNEVQNQSMSSLGEHFRPHSTQRMASASLEDSRFMSSINQLSISSVNVPECKPLGDDGEIHRYAFEQWKDLLVDSMQLAGIVDEATQFMIFKVKAGIRLLDIYKNTKSDDSSPDAVLLPFSNAMHRLKTYFSSGSDVMLQRRKLALLFQKQGESDSAYITKVGAIARMCEYSSDGESEAILSTVSTHARCKEVRTAALKLLHRKGSFTELIDKVREIECIQLSEQFFKERHEPAEQVTIAPVSADFPLTGQQFRGQNYGRFGFRHRGYSRRPYNRSGNHRFLGKQRPAQQACWRCTSSTHEPSYCHAVDKVCRTCGQKGHIRVACRANVHTGTKREIEYDVSTPEEPVRKIAAIHNQGNEDVPEEKVSDATEN